MLTIMMSNPHFHLTFVFFNGTSLLTLHVIEKCFLLSLFLMWNSVGNKLRWEPGITSIEFHNVRGIEPGTSYKKYRGN